MLGPPLLVGDRVAHVGGEEPVLASVRWLGRLPDLFHHQMVAGLFLDEPQILGTCNGSFANRKLFHCHPNHGKFVPLAELVKEEDFFNMLARQQREMRSMSRSSSRSDRNPTYMNTTQPTYQNHFFETQDQWQDRQDRQEWQEWEELHHNPLPPSHRTRWGDARRGDWHEQQAALRQSEFLDPGYDLQGALWRGRHGGGYSGGLTRGDNITIVCLTGLVTQWHRKDYTPYRKVEVLVESTGIETVHQGTTRLNRVGEHQTWAL